MRESTHGPRGWGGHVRCTGLVVYRGKPRLDGHGFRIACTREILLVPAGNGQEYPLVPQSSTHQTVLPGWVRLIGFSGAAGDGVYRGKLEDRFRPNEVYG